MKRNRIMIPFLFFDNDLQYLLGSDVFGNYKYNCMQFLFKKKEF